MYGNHMHSQSTHGLRLFLTASLFLIALIASGVADANPKIQHWTTTNGARVYFVASPELPIVDVRVVFDAGSARDGKHSGLARLTNGLLDQGAGDLNADQIADRLDGVGANLDTSSYRDMAIVSLRSLTDPTLLDPALHVMALVVGQPSFPGDAFKLAQKRTLIALRGQKESPGDIAEKAFFAAVYGDHPYASPSLGTEEAVSALTRQDVISFHKRYYTGANAVVAIVGAIDRKAAKKIAEQVMGKLPAGQAAPALPPAKTLAAAKTERVAYPSAQTHILMGQPGISRGDPDYFPLVVGNHILGGGGLVSRISEEVREKRGLAYSAYSYFTPMHVAGPFIAGLQTRNEKADAALEVLRDTLRNFIAKGPTTAELSAAKKNITGGFPLNLDSNSKIVDNLASIGFYQLPLDYLDTYNKHVEAVTADQIRDAFRRRIHPQDMVTVMVGGESAATAKQ
ncbi:MAG: pitrilysin family protein [Gammaproteobacteria bacterium]|jgi:zinc protease